MSAIAPVQLAKTTQSKCPTGRCSRAMRIQPRKQFRTSFSKTSDACRKPTMPPASTTPSVFSTQTLLPIPKKQACIIWNGWSKALVTSSRNHPKSLSSSSLRAPSPTAPAKAGSTIPSPLLTDYSKAHRSLPCPTAQASRNASLRPDTTKRKTAVTSSGSTMGSARCSRHSKPVDNWKTR